MMEENQVADSTLSSTDLGNDQQGKTFTRDQLAKIVASESDKAARNAALKAQQEAEAKHQKEIEALRAAQDQRNSQVSREIDTDALYQNFQERLNKEIEENQRRAHAQQVTSNYLGQVEKAKSAYQDFDEVSKDYDPTAFPQVTYLLAGLEGGSDVLYSLMKNPLKMASIDNLAIRNPMQAKAELEKMAQSIQTNKQAQADEQNSYTAEPLDRLQPSRVSGSNGQMSISDLQKQPWLRG